MILLLLACERPPSDSCEAATRRLGHVACVHRVDDAETWDAIARPSELAGEVEITKWAAPFGDDSPLAETVFLNSNSYPLHWEMLRAAFPETFGDLTHLDYSRLVLHPAYKSLHSGNVSSYDGEDGRFYGFTVWDDRTRPALTVTYDDVLGLWLDLDARFGLAPLVFVPNTDVQAENASGWDAPFRVHLP